jgi:hypothetical protein
MTRKKLAVIMGICILGVSYLWWHSPVLSPEEKKAQSLPSIVESQERKPAEEEKETALPSLPSSPSAQVFAETKQWEKKLRQQFFHQGQRSLKKVEIKKERSLYWEMDGIKIRVESIVVNLTHQEGQSSSFRALVDPATGKIIETWDRTVFDPVDKSKEFRFNLDPRYSP